MVDFGETSCSCQLIKKNIGLRRIKVIFFMTEKFHIMELPFTCTQYMSQRFQVLKKTHSVHGHLQIPNLLSGIWIWIWIEISKVVEKMAETLCPIQLPFVESIGDKDIVFCYPWHVDELKFIGYFLCELSFPNARRSLHLYNAAVLIQSACRPVYEAAPVRETLGFIRERLFVLWVSGQLSVSFKSKRCNCFCLTRKQYRTSAEDNTQSCLSKGHGYKVDKLQTNGRIVYFLPNIGVLSVSRFREGNRKRKWTPLDNGL